MSKPEQTNPSNILSIDPEKRLQELVRKYNSGEIGAKEVFRAKLRYGIYMKNRKAILNNNPSNRSDS